jgi:hypothetical protein
MTIRYEVRTLGSPPGWFPLSRHRLFKAACRACVAFIEEGLDAFVYLADSGLRVRHRYEQTARFRYLHFVNPDPDANETVTVLYRGRRARP